MFKSFWLEDPGEPESKFKKRKNKTKKKKKNKNSSNLIVENDLESQSTSYEINNPNYDEVYDHNFNRNCRRRHRFYEVDIDEKEYQYLLENNLIEKEYTEESFNLEFNRKEEDDEDESRNLLIFDEENDDDDDDKKKKKENKSKWFMDDEEFEEFEMTEDQKLKCAAFFIWIISLVIFFYFQDYFISHDKNKDRNGQSEIDRIKEIGRNRFPPGFGVPNGRNNKFGMPEMDPAEQLSRYFDRNQRSKSHHPESRYGRRYDNPYDDENLDDEEDLRRRKGKMKRKSPIQKPKIKDNIKRILWWTNDFPDLYKNKKIFDYYGCEYKNCEFLDDRDQLRESHAIVFNYYQINLTDLPANRRKNQLLIFYSDDEPSNYQNKKATEYQLNENLKFNLSWSFTLDSTIKLNTGNLIFDDKLIEIENSKKNKLQIKREKWLSKSKTKDTLILLSNTCKTIKLLEHHNNLNKLIDLIDKEEENKINKTENQIELKNNTNIKNETTNYDDRIRDKNQDYKLDNLNILNLNQINRINKKLKFNSILTAYEKNLLDYLINEINRTNLEYDLLMNCALSNNELKNLIKNYKFLLIIENQSCKNYQNNLVYLSLEVNTIPILNNNNYNQYNTKLPTNSFIKLNEFKNLNTLNDYLLKLKSNWNQFYSHLNWTNYFKVSYRKTDICELCDKLNRINNKNRNQYVKEITPLNWINQAQCFTHFDHFK